MSFGVWLVVELFGALHHKVPCRVLGCAPAELQCASRRLSVAIRRPCMTLYRERDAVILYLTRHALTCPALKQSQASLMLSERAGESRNRQRMPLTCATDVLSCVPGNPACHADLCGP